MFSNLSKLPPYRTKSDHEKMFTTTFERQLEPTPDYDYAYIWNLLRSKGLTCPATGEIKITVKDRHIVGFEVDCK